MRPHQVQEQFVHFLRGLRPTVEQVQCFAERLAKYFATRSQGHADDSLHRQKQLKALQEFRERLAAIDVDISQVMVAQGDVMDPLSLDREEVLLAGVHLLAHISLIWETLALTFRARFEPVVLSARNSIHHRISVSNHETRASFRPS